MSIYLNYIVVLGVLFVILFLLKSYENKIVNSKIEDEHALIQEYLLNESTLAKSDKPLLWIHITFEKNARWWPSFGSRLTECLNQPYQFLTIKSIIDHCGDSFNIVLIDDKSFNKIIPKWNNKVGNLPAPLRPHLREIAMAKILYYYGGMTLPSSFICLKNIQPLYIRGLLNCDMFCGELQSRSLVSNYSDYFPSHQIMGCIKQSDMMKNYINYLEVQMSSDYTNEIDIEGETNKWLYQGVLDKKIMLLCSKYWGASDNNGDPVLIDDLVGDNDDFSISKEAYGLLIPQNELLQRSTYQWIVRMDPQQVLESNTIIARYLLLSN